MSWTEFYATMTDGTEFRFGTQFSTEFFDMPIGYVATNIRRLCQRFVVRSRDMTRFTARSHFSHAT